MLLADFGGPDDLFRNPELKLRIWLWSKAVLVPPKVRWLILI